MINMKKITCGYCLIESNGGISRARQHQIWITWNLSTCIKTLEEVKLILTAHEESRLTKVKYVSCNVYEDEDETSLFQEISWMVNGKG